MIKTKIAFLIFLTLSLIVFPHYIFIDSDFLNSVIPGWNTTIIPARVISSLFKFIILILITSYYWKLSKYSSKIDFKKFLIHLSFTIPAILVSKLNVYEFVRINLYDSESFLSQIQMVVFINVIFNILFFVGQILFGANYYRSIKDFKNLKLNNDIRI